MIAIVLEIHDSLNSEIEAQFAKYNTEAKLYKLLKDEDTETMKLKLENAAQQIKILQEQMARDEVAEDAQNESKNDLFEREQFEEDDR